MNFMAFRHLSKYHISICLRKRLSQDGRPLKSFPGNSDFSANALPTKLRPQLGKPKVYELHSAEVMLVIRTNTEILHFV